MEVARTTTQRGFDVSSFTDRYGAECSIQKSSLATEEAIWFGVNNPTPMILASSVIDGGTGWAKYPIHDDVTITTRMHLTRERVAALLPILQRFVDTGEI